MVWYGRWNRTTLRSEKELYGFETVPLWRSGLSVASIIGERRACTSGTRERRRLERTEMKALKGTDNRVLEVGRHG